MKWLVELGLLAFCLLCLTGCSHGNVSTDAGLDQQEVITPDADGDQAGGDPVDSDGNEDQEAVSDDNPDPCGTPDLSMTNRYPISGYFLFARHGNCVWRETLETIHRLGADTVIQFGNVPVLTTSDFNHGQDDLYGIWRLCVQNSVSCYNTAVADLLAGNPNATLRNELVLYYSDEQFGSAILTNPPLDKFIGTFGAHQFWRLLLPLGNNQYQMVLIHGSSVSDSLGELLAQALKKNMQVYAGFPTAISDPVLTYEVNQAKLPLVMELTQRILTDYAQRHGSINSFVGVYQSFETPLRADLVDSAMSLYDQQHALVRSLLPQNGQGQQKQILMSPYWNARQDVTWAGIDGVRTGIQQLVNHNVDIIAPQDGRGRGTAGTFWPWENPNEIDCRLKLAFDGNTLTNVQAYRSSTKEMFLAARQGLDDISSRVELWANVEAYEWGVGPECSDYMTSLNMRRTSKERLDQAIMFDGEAPSKLISFMWDDLYACPGGGVYTGCSTQGPPSAPLATEIASDWQRPIVTTVGFSDSPRGITLLGYNLVYSDTQNTIAIISYYPGGTDYVHVDVALASGWSNPSFGANSSGRYPNSMQQVWVPFDYNLAISGTWVHVNYQRPDGVAGSHVYSIIRP